MRKLRKIPADDAVSAADIAWLAQQAKEYADARKNGEDESKYLKRYGDERVKRTILRETLEKCAYCETKYGPGDWGDVEHILPKAGHPERLLDYRNLTLVCRRCNGAKSNKEYTDGAPLLDPYEHDVDQHLYAAGPMVVPHTDLAVYVSANRTITDIKLNRRELMERRAEYINDKYTRLLFAYHSAPNDAVRNFTRSEIEQAQSENAEYTLVARWFFRDKGIV